MKRTRRHKHKNVIGPRLEQARQRSRPPVSQEDLSARLQARWRVHISQASLSKLERQQRYVLDYEAEAIAKALRVSVAWLYGESR